MQPFQSARRELPGELDDIVRLTARQPNVAPEAVGLRHAVLSYIDDYADPFVQNPLPSRRSTLYHDTLPGKRLMDRVRARYAALGDGEQRLGNTFVAQAR